MRQARGKKKTKCGNPRVRRVRMRERPRATPSRLCDVFSPPPLLSRADDDWRRTTFFYSYSISENQTAKLVIDGGSSLHVVSKTAIPYLGLEPEPHPHPYRVAWVDKTTIPVTERCLVPREGTMREFGAMSCPWTLPRSSSADHGSTIMMSPITGRTTPMSSDTTVKR